MSMELPGSVRRAVAGGTAALASLGLFGAMEAGSEAAEQPFAIDYQCPDEQGVGVHFATVYETNPQDPAPEPENWPRGDLKVTFTDNHEASEEIVLTYDDQFDGQWVGSLEHVFQPETEFEDSVLKYTATFGPNVGEMVEREIDCVLDETTTTTTTTESTTTTQEETTTTTEQSTTTTTEPETTTTTQEPTTTSTTQPKATTTTRPVETTTTVETTTSTEPKQTTTTKPAVTSSSQVGGGESVTLPSTSPETSPAPTVQVQEQLPKTGSNNNTLPIGLGALVLGGSAALAFGRRRTA